LRIAEITANTPNPADGEIDRDESEQPTGLLREFAQILIRKHVPAYTVDEICEYLKKASRMYVSTGVTSIVDAGLGFSGGLTDAAAVMQVSENGGLPVRYGAAISYLVWKQLKEGAGPGLQWPCDPEWVRPLAVKIFRDGSLFTAAALSTPSRGQTKSGDQYLLFSQDDFEEMVTDAHTSGWQIWIHANGDVAIQSVLDAYEKALAIQERADHRHRIEHCQLPTDEQLDRMAALGVLPSFFPAHIWHWGDRHLSNFGPERAARLSPMASALMRDLNVGMHNDSPFTPMEPMVQVGAAVTRCSKSGDVLGPEQGISVDQALKALTLGNAYLAFEEGIKGSLVTGKLGDVVVLEADPYRVKPEELVDIAVSMTIVGGKVVYRRD
jgi:predicted amidohydrolase YtcJ